jgi:hypothetical protein
MSSIGRSPGAIRIVGALRPHILPWPWRDLPDRQLLPKLLTGPLQRLPAWAQACQIREVDIYICCIRPINRPLPTRPDDFHGEHFDTDER